MLECFTLIYGMISQVYVDQKSNQNVNDRGVMITTKGKMFAIILERIHTI
jgi:hypothetical protein